MLTKDNNYAVMRLFFNAPERRFHIREIARLARLSAPGVLKIVARLKKEGLLLSKREGPVEKVSANKTPRFADLKICYNQLAIRESGLAGFLRDEYEEPEAIVLFGSFAHGGDTSASDIDVAVVTRRSRSLSLKGFEAKLGRKISLYEVDLKECRKDFINNLANGIVLYGYLKVV